MAIKLYDLTDISSQRETFKEIIRTLFLVDPGYDPSRFAAVYENIVALFGGKYPGFRASNTKYHNLEHTCSVTLAAARLIHGLRVQGQIFPSRNMELCLIAALFHDTGLIQTEEERDGTGARFTVGHEERSIRLMAAHLAANGFSEGETSDCGHIIMATIISLPMAEIPFRSEGIRTMGKILGSADLIAQMSDRRYLEKLPLLFLEFKEAGIPGFETPLQLFKNTGEFYHSVVRKRLREEMADVSSAALFHFRKRWDIDRDLYAESISNNLEYMSRIYRECDNSFDSLLKKLRRRV